MTTPPPNDRVRLFVYGTLKRGSRNARRLRGQTFLHEAVTAPRYRLYDVGDFPALVEDTVGVSVIGELWEVGRACLADLDTFEGTAEELFERRPVELADGSVADAYLYAQPTKGLRDLGAEYL